MAYGHGQPHSLSRHTRQLIAAKTRNPMDGGHGERLLAPVACHEPEFPADPFLPKRTSIAEDEDVREARKGLRKVLG